MGQRTSGRIPMPANYRPSEAMPGQIGMGLAPWLRQGGVVDPYRFPYSAELGGAAPRPDRQPMPITPPIQGLPSPTPTLLPQGGAGGGGVGFDYDRMQAMLSDLLRQYRQTPEQGAQGIQGEPGASAPVPDLTPSMGYQPITGPGTAYDGGGAPPPVQSAGPAPSPEPAPTPTPTPEVPAGGNWYDADKAAREAEAAAAAERLRQEELARQAALAEQLRQQQLAEQQAQEGLVRRRDESSGDWFYAPSRRGSDSD